MHVLPQNAILYADENRGIYIPKFFAESIVREKLSGVSPTALDTLERGPEDNPDYWEAWQEVLDDARMTMADGSVWMLYQDGDLWAVPEDWTPDGDPF